MLPEHKDAFFKTADAFNCRIGLREPNPLSDQYIGRGGYMPKNEHCKAKTADNPGHPFKGLVVNPETCPEAFLRGSLKAALEKWRGFAAEMPPGFTLEKADALKGLVKYFGKSIHGDFELTFVSKMDEAGNIVLSPKEEQALLTQDVADYINGLIGIKMIAESVETDLRGETGVPEWESIWVFGPDRAFREDGSSTADGTGETP